MPLLLFFSREILLTSNSLFSFLVRVIFFKTTKSVFSNL